MSTIPPAVEDALNSEVQEGLDDEISDVIERHGRGRDADSLLGALEEVFAQGGRGEEWSRDPSRGELQRALTELLERCPEGARREDVREALERVAEDLRGGSLQPSVRWVRREKARDRLRVIYDSAFGLKRAIPDLVDIRGFFVECDVRPPMMDDLEIVIEAGDVDATVSLTGRVVRTADHGIAVQCYGLDETTKQELRALPDAMAEEGEGRGEKG